MAKSNFRGSQRGQVLLIVVLVLVIGLVVALTVVTRTVTNLRISTEEENSQRAFSAAEAGIEQVLKSGTNSSSNLGNNSSFTATTNTVSGHTFLINDGKTIFKDDGVDVWFSTYPTYANPLSASNFMILWGLPSDDCNNTPPPAALEVILLSGNINSPQSTRYALDPCSRGNGFSGQLITGNFTVGTNNFKYRTNSSGANAITISNALLMRIIPIYANTEIGISACSSVGNGSCTNLPVQGSRVESIGRDTTSNTIRKIAVFQGFPKLPNEFFQYSLFSP